MSSAASIVMYAEESVIMSVGAMMPTTVNFFLLCVGCAFGSAAYSASVG